MTESVVARADGNYAAVDDIAADVRAKLGGGTVGVVFPILSRNRFAICLRGIARGSKKVVLMLSYPSDEVGNHLFDLDALDASGVDPYRDLLTLEDYRRIFGVTVHPFTGVDYVEYYKDLIEEEGAEAEVIFSNRPEAITKFAKDVLCCDIHSRERTRRHVLAAGAEKALTLTEILNAPVNGSGYCPEYGLLGSNKANEDRVKLFPKNAQQVADGIRDELVSAHRRKGRGHGVRRWGLQGPRGQDLGAGRPGRQPGLHRRAGGCRTSCKLKYLADNEFAGLTGEELTSAIRESIRQKGADLKGRMVSEGTTPRRLTDLVGSLCDLTSGSGDKGTPIIVVQNYFKNYSE